MERKLIQIGDCDFKFDAGDGSFKGYASVFNGVDSYGDMIMPGAYAQTIKNRARPVSMFFNHIARRQDMPSKIGVWDSFEEDSKGLLVSGRLTKGHPTADAVLASMKSGAISGLSIGYRVAPGGSEKDGKIRKLSRIDLVEVSIVDDPADAAALIDRNSIKAAVDEMKTLADCEAFIREECGFSHNAAADFISRMRTVILGEPGDTGLKSEMTSILNNLKSINLPAVGA